VIDVSVSAFRLVLSGIMERHPKLKVFVSHTGGALPYQAGRMDKNAKAAGLPEPPSTYIKRMYTDIVTPHALGMKFAIDFYGVDRVMYGSDYPCWSPAAALELFDEIGLSAVDQEKILYGNARRILGLRDLAPTAPALREAVAV
jgi:aminocarboxymuconate-semialdehyde decarboxylase